MSNLATQARAIALIARDAFPNAKTVRLETSDQGEHLTYSSPFVIDADGTEHDAEDAEYDMTDDLWDPTCDISWDEAGEGDCPGWTVLNRRGGYYELDIATILADKPTFKDSGLAGALRDFVHSVQVLPSEPPILMADVDEPRCTHCGQDVQQDEHGSWVDATDGDGCDNPSGVHESGGPHIRAVRPYCPRCGSGQLRELDWATRQNPLRSVQFDDTNGSSDLYVTVEDAPAHFEALVCFCGDCGQVLDLSDHDVEIVRD